MERLFGEDETPAAAGSTTLPGAPLATRLRPRTLDEFVGQDRLLAAGSSLRRAIEEGHPHSMILHGPPGSGKTTLARLIADASDAAFEEESAVQAGRAEVRGVIDRARQRLGATGRRTIFFLDEIHRFNKAQQDALLPAVEEGLVTLIGATTENPYFEVNSALLSRARIYELEPLSAADMRVLLDRAVARGECAGGAGRPGGDRVSGRSVRRRCANGFERARARLPDGRYRRGRFAGAGRGCAAAAGAALRPPGRPPLRHDLGLDQGDTGSDPDASLYYLAVMLEGGEDPRFIVRRMVVLASEDIGNADPQALTVATAAAAAVEHVGMPEAQFALAQAAIYLSLAPKSDAAKRAVIASREFIRERGAEAPPAWLRSSTRSDGGYDNPHRRPGHFSSQELMPDSAIGQRFYEPDDAEAALRKRFEEIRRARGRA